MASLVCRKCVFICDKSEAEVPVCKNCSALAKCWHGFDKTDFLGDILPYLLKISMKPWNVNQPLEIVTGFLEESCMNCSAIWLIAIWPNTWYSFSNNSRFLIWNMKKFRGSRSYAKWNFTIWAKIKCSWSLILHNLKFFGIWYLLYLNKRNSLEFYWLFY